MRRGTATGKTIVEEINWHDNMRHGPSYTYIGDAVKTEYYFQGKEVSKSQFENFNEFEGSLMDQLIEIHWSSGSIDEARKICRYLVQERFVACAQITPWIESIYMWNNQLETAQESKIVLKTRQDKYDSIKEVILR